MLKRIDYALLPPLEQRRLVNDRIYRFRQVLLPKYEKQVRALETRIPAEKSWRLFRCRNLVASLRLRVVRKMAEFSAYLKKDPLVDRNIPLKRVASLVQACDRLLEAVDQRIADSDRDFAPGRSIVAQLSADTVYAGNGLVFDRELGGPDNIELREGFLRRHHGG